MVGGSPDAQMENLSTAHLKSFRGKQLRIQYWGSKQPESFPCEAEEYVPVPVHGLVCSKYNDGGSVLRMQRC
jgi:hypothetical protein